VKAVVAWFARNSVAANLLMLLFVAGGLVTLPTIKQEVFPEVRVDVVQVTVPYRGAAPEEVEQAICIRVEERLQGVEGVRKLRCNAAEGMGVVTVEVEFDADPREVLEDVKRQVDAIDTFPAETEKPIVQQLVMRAQVINVAVAGDVDEWTLRHLAQRVRDDLTEIPGITHVTLANARPFEISIEVSEEALRRHGLTFDQVVDAVRRSSIDLPGGSLKTEGGEILLRAKGQAYRAPEFERLVLISRADGTRVVVGDVARVVDGFEETDQSATFDGKPAMLVQVFRVGEQGALDIAAKVKRWVAETQPTLPEGVTLTTFADDSEILRSRLDTILASARSGFVLVLVSLALFLRLRVAFWVGMGVPVSILAAIWVLPSFDVSINALTLFAFLLVLGILVDDAIVVGENVHSYQSRRRDPLRAAIAGTQEVSVPVIFGVLTTVAAFMPLALIPGAMGKLTASIPIVVIAALVFSLVESQLCLPAHLAHGSGHDQPRTRAGRAWLAVQARVARGLAWFLEQVYSPFLDRALRWRLLTAACAVGLSILTVGLVGGGWTRFVFFPKVEADNVIAFLAMPQGTPAEITAEAVARIDRAAHRLREELAAEGHTVFRHVIASVGSQPYRERQNRNSDAGSGAITSGAGHLGEVNVELTPSETRAVLATEVAARWRELVGPIPDAVELSFTSSLFSAGEAVNVELRGNDPDALRAAAAEVRAELERYPGVFDVTDSFRGGKQELKLAIKPSAEGLGLSLADLAGQVRQAFFGDEAQRIQRGRDEVRVMVRYPKSQRRSLGDVERMYIRTADGAAVPFAAVAEVELGRGFATIERSQRARVLSVTADVDQSRVTPNEIVADLRARVLPAVLAAHPGVDYAMQGEQAEQQEFLSSMLRRFVLSLFAILALLAIPLGSYVQPLIIMTAIPFGMVGAIWGHVLTGYELSMFSVIGMVALAGVVVNDSLVLVDFVNRARESGVKLDKAVRQAGVQRFRPIFLTSITTFLGLTPLLLERSVQAQFLIPMAISLAFGVMFSTGVSLVLVPATYLLLDDLKRAFAGAPRVRPEPGRAAATPPARG